MTTYESLSQDQQLMHLKQLASNALQAWQLHAKTLELIKYRENAVYCVLTDDNRQFALRIHRPGYHTDAALRSELQWMFALAKDGTEVPQIIPTPDGQLFVNASAEGDPQLRQVDLFAWVEGQELGSVENGLGNDPQVVKQIYRTIGQKAAQLHNHASQWQLPEAFQRHAWDLEGLVGEQPFWGRFWELEALTDQQRQLICNTRETIRTGLEAYGQTADNYSLIHADFVPENLLVDGEHVRLLDFDDAGFGWHLFELATALYFIQDEPHYEVAKAALINGYREFRSLPDSELQYLPLFLAARGFTYLGWVQSRWETETAREMTPMLVQLACETAERFLRHSRPAD